MSNLTQLDWEDEDGARERQREARTARSQRALLGEAVGGPAPASMPLTIMGRR